ncbi:3024_t:CDS:2 [Cetraspora pellucida]|uniref:3024_t:CDS:1 n=1 Tax=Cetraspora pellucida TaxID=1433469 RepID=A0A9N8VLN2_9GLOM|nr:3024_t:CDS:2 [Cetraspora pellucida]
MYKLSPYICLTTKSSVQEFGARLSQNTHVTPSCENSNNILADNAEVMLYQSRKRSPTVRNLKGNKLIWKRITKQFWKNQDIPFYRWDLGNT